MKIWIDLENSPHVPFFVPIVRDLREHQVDVVLTARDFAQTRELVENAGLDVEFVGREVHGGTVMRTAAILVRAVRLALRMRSEKIDLAVGHGSRGLLLAARMLGIRSLVLYDYEGASIALFNRLANYIMTPNVLTFEHLQEQGLRKEKHLTYLGLKEEVYLASFTPDAAFPQQLGLDSQRIIVTARPPSDTAHYRSEESQKLFHDVMKLVGERDCQVILSPRTARQSSELRSASWFDPSKMIIPDRAVDGANLLYHSDLVVGGGGTMNREAAVLDVPVASVFKGPMGAVDAYLASIGKLIAIDRAEQVSDLLRKRTRTLPPHKDLTREAISETILRLAAV